MKATRFLSFSTVVVGIPVLGAAVPCLAGGTDCQTGSTVKVCVVWGQPFDPVHGVDYEVDFTDPSNPDISLLKGDDAWELYAEVVGFPAVPANIGAITIDPAQDADNFGVKIAKGLEPGAVNVGSMVLDGASNPNWTGHSIITGGVIAGNLTGDLTVVADSSDDGAGLCPAKNTSRLYRTPSRVVVSGGASVTLYEKAPEL